MFASENRRPQLALWSLFLSGGSAAEGSRRMFGGTPMLHTETLTLNKEFRRAYYRGRAFTTPVVVVYVLKNHKGINRIGARPLPRRSARRSGATARGGSSRRPTACWNRSSPSGTTTSLSPAPKRFSPPRRRSCGQCGRSSKSWAKNHETPAALPDQALPAAAFPAQGKAHLPLLSDLVRPDAYTAVDRSASARCAAAISR